MKNNEQRDTVLRQARSKKIKNPDAGNDDKAKDFHISLVPDKTKNERDRYRALKVELEARKLSGENDIVIRGNQIVKLPFRRGNVRPS